MWPFNSPVWPFNGPEEEEKANSSEEETVKVEETCTKEYTEHVGVIEYADGDTVEVRFDSMYRDENSIVLKNYVEYRFGSYMMMHDGFVKEAFMTIPYQHLKSFETTDRITREMEYTKTVEKPISEVTKNNDTEN